jgi:hypothetical protein
MSANLHLYFLQIFKQFPSTASPTDSILTPFKPQHHPHTAHGHEELFALCQHVTAIPPTLVGKHENSIIKSGGKLAMKKYSQLFNNLNLFLLPTVRKLSFFPFLRSLVISIFCSFPSRTWIRNEINGLRRFHSNGSLCRKDVVMSLSGKLLFCFSVEGDTWKSKEICGDYGKAIKIWLKLASSRAATYNLENTTQSPWIPHQFLRLCSRFQ